MIVPLHAVNPSAMTGEGNWTYFLPGPHPVLIDAGTGAEAHIQAIDNERREGPGHVLVTHAHGDHASGASTLAARWPDTEFSKFPWPERDLRYPVPWRTLIDGERVQAGDAVLEVVHTPGHAPDHVAFWHPASRTLLSGDLVIAGTSVVILATQGGSLRQYLASLQRVLDLAPARLLPAHGPPIEDPDAIIRRYLDHRREREAQVVAALRSGVTTVDAIVDRVYPGLSTPLVPMARESVLAHLIKLEEDGQVSREEQTWLME